MTDAASRKELLQKLEAQRESRVILYVTGDRPGLEAQIGADVVDLFTDHLDCIGPVPKISLVLYTMGGDTAAAWTLVNLLGIFCDDFEVIAPGKCRSAGTLICLGANRTVMTKQATLGPIDPTIQNPLGPAIPGASGDARAPVSVEAVRGYLDAVSEDDHQKRASALMGLAEKVHPLVLGQVFRSRQQIRDLAGRLLDRQTVSKGSAKKIIDFLCSESGSHDYTINRREAEALGIKIEKCSTLLYGALQKLSNSYTQQMELRNSQNPAAAMTTHAHRAHETGGKPTRYTHTRAILESVHHGAHHYVSEGVLEVTATGNQRTVQDVRQYDGWKLLP